MKNLDSRTEMQKAADAADISVLFFSAGANFWVILGHFWAILGYFGSFWVILDHFGSFWTILGHLVEFWLQKHHLHCIVKFKKNAPNLDFLCRE